MMMIEIVEKKVLAFTFSQGNSFRSKDKNKGRRQNLSQDNI